MVKLHPESARASLTGTEPAPFILLVRPAAWASPEALLQANARPWFPGGLRANSLELIHGFTISATAEQVNALATHDEVLAIWSIPTPLFPAYANIIKSIEYYLEQNPAGGPIECEPRPSPEFLPMSYEPEEPMNLATKAAFDRGCLTVFSVGNAGPAQDTLNPWGLAPWVIGVGATSEDGSLLWKESSRGRPGDAIYHPTVVAPGIDILTTHPSGVPKGPELLEAEKRTGFYDKVPREKWPLYTVVTGTSFAAGHVTRIVTQLYFFLTQAEHEAAAGGASSFEIEYPFAMKPDPSERRAGTVIPDPTHFKVKYPAKRDPAVIRQIVIDAAQPVPGTQFHESGGGFVQFELIGELFGKYGLANPMLMPLKVVD